MLTISASAQTLLDKPRRSLQTEKVTPQKIKQLDLSGLQNGKKQGNRNNADLINAQLSHSPSSTGMTPKTGGGIEDIKSASLYDLIKLQMVS